MTILDKQNRVLSAVALASALVVGLPFLNKPIHIDDTFVLAVAEQICRDPLRPFSGSFNWFDDPQPVFQITTNPPFLSYWIAPVLAAFGASEIALHLAMLPFLILLALASASLSRRFAQGSVWPVLFVMFSPAVVVSPNVMRDVPAAALATAAVALFVAGTDRDRWSYAILGSLLAGLATLTKYSAVIMLPVLALYPIFRRKPRYLLAILAAGAVIGLWFAQNMLVHGKIHLLAMKSAEKANLNVTNLFTAALVITGAALLVVPALLAGAIRRRDWATPLGAVAAAVGTGFLIRKWYPGQGTIQYYTWAILGAMLLYWIFIAELIRLLLILIFGPVSSSRKPQTPNPIPHAPDPRPETPDPIPQTPCTSDTFFLLAWLIGPYVCAILFVEFPAVRHILPAAAPIVLLAIRYCQWPHAGRTLTLSNVALGIGLAVQVVLAFWTGAADYQYADTYRRFAREAEETLTVPQGNRIWFRGHWGWQHYASASGFAQLTKSGPDIPKSGDLVLTADVVHKGALPDGLEPRLEQIKDRPYPARLNMVTMDWVHASFYATFGVTTPQYYIKGQNYETFRVMRVKP